jgi:hypothetical protein
MQSLSWFFILLTFCVVMVSGQQMQKTDISSILSGTSFGKCVGYCRQSIEINFKTLEVTATREANFNQGTFPPIHLKFAVTSTEWNNLIDLIDLQAWKSLDDRIGCPDCADGGEEWIQIDWKIGGKRITFENGQAVKGLEEFIDKLRDMRKFYFDKF